MAIFRRPPPVFVGGTQPYANRTFSPVPAGTVITFDAVAPAEWSTNTQTNATASVEWGITSRRDTAGPVEWTLAALRDMETPVEWGVTSRRDTVAPTEWNITAFRDAAVPIDPLAFIARDTVAPFDASLAVSGSNLTPIEWSGGVTLTTDFSDPLEWRTTLLGDTIISSERRSTFNADTSAHVEWLLSFLAACNAAVPVEWLGSTVIAADAADAIEWRGATAFTSTLFAEWRSPAVADAVGLAEWRTTTVSDALEGTWWLAGAVTGATTPVDAGGSATSYGALPVDPLGSAFAGSQITAEWRSTWAVDTATPTTWNTLIDAYAPSGAMWVTSAGVSDTATPPEWGLSTLADIAVPVDGKTTGAFNVVVFIDWGAAIAPSDTTAPVGISASVARNIDASGLFYSITYRDVLAGLNWTGPIGVILDGGVPLEWRSVSFIDNITPLELPGSARHDGLILTTWSASLLRDDTTAVGVASVAIGDAFVPTVWTSAPTANFISNISWSSPTSQDLIIPAGLSLSTTRDDGSVLSLGLTVISIELAPSEWGGAAGVISNTIAGVEYRSSRSADVVFTPAWIASMAVDASGWVDFGLNVIPIDYQSSLTFTASTVTENQIPAAWLAPAVFDVIVPLDVVGIIDQVSGDAVASFEFGSTTLVNAPAWIDWTRSFAARHTKGATLDAPPFPSSAEIAEGSGPKGATLEAPPVPTAKRYREGSGSKGSTLER